MSCMEKKVVFRAEIKELKGKNNNEAYDYFKDIIGEADETDYYGDELENFSYEGDFVPVSDYEGRWAIDLVLHHSSDEFDYVGKCDLSAGLTLDDIIEYINILVDKFGVDAKDVKFLSYDWYNGGDESVVI